MAVEVGSVVEGKVINIMPFGAFVSLPEGKTGLVHISEVAIDYVSSVEEHLKPDQVVKVKVVSIDEKGKISLSIKKVLLEEKKKAKSEPKKQGFTRPADIDWQEINRAKNEDLSFEDKLSKFKAESDEKMQFFKRGTESRRSGGYKRSSGNY